jgi:hypothetical protein
MSLIANKYKLIFPIFLLVFVLFSCQKGGEPVPYGTNSNGGDDELIETLRTTNPNDEGDAGSQDSPEETDDDSGGDADGGVIGGDDNEDDDDGGVVGGDDNEDDDINVVGGKGNGGLGGGDLGDDGSGSGSDNGSGGN